MSKELRVSEINVDHDVQIREATNTDAINEYSEVIDDLPPVIVFRDKEGQNWLADGFHRYQAAIKAKKLRIKCDVRTGEKRDAILFACGANRDHGLRRTNADKRRAVERLLDDPEWGKWSDGKVAEAAAVSRPFVSGLRGQLETVSSRKNANPKKPEVSENPPPQKSEPETRIGRDGKERKAPEPKPEETTADRVKKFRSTLLQLNAAMMRAADDWYECQPWDDHELLLENCRHNVDLIKGTKYER